MRITKILAVTSMLGLLVSSLSIAETVSSEGHPGQAEFIDRVVATGQYSAAEVNAILAEAEHKQSILDIYKRPAESKPWFTYHPIFITQQRLDEGLVFWRENQQAISAASSESGVEEEIIVAIIGVETYYGRILGNYRVIDALTTLGFYFPRRQEFFSKELLEYLLLTKEESLPLTEVKGSYAGAMGLGQFMPSSYRAYAVDADGDGRRDLWGSRPDAIASVANYFKAHHWRQGELIAVPATRASTADKVKTKLGKPASSLADYASKGYVSETELAMETPANLIVLEQEKGHDYWLTFHNFYVITRYNRSPMYAMVVKQLSEQLRAVRAAGK